MVPPYPQPNGCRPITQFVPGCPPMAALLDHTVPTLTISSPRLKTAPPNPWPPPPPCGPAFEPGPPAARLSARKQFVNQRRPRLKIAPPRPGPPVTNSQHTGKLGSWQQAMALVETSPPTPPVETLFERTQLSRTRFPALKIAPPSAGPPYWSKVPLVPATLAPVSTKSRKVTLTSAGMVNSRFDLEPVNSTVLPVATTTRSCRNCNSSGISKIPSHAKQTVPPWVAA